MAEKKARTDRSDTEIDLEERVKLRVDERWAHHIPGSRTGI